MQVTVALMDKLHLGDQGAQEAAQKFAVDLFNKWGVGDAGCQNGVLLLLSRLDRQVRQSSKSLVSKFSL